MHLYPSLLSIELASTPKSWFYRPALDVKGLKTRAKTPCHSLRSIWTLWEINWLRFVHGEDCQGQGVFPSSCRHLESARQRFWGLIRHARGLVEHISAQLRSGCFREIVAALKVKNQFGQIRHQNESNAMCYQTHSKSRVLLLPDKLLQEIVAKIWLQTAVLLYNHPIQLFQAHYIIGSQLISCNLTYGMSRLDWYWQSSEYKQETLPDSFKQVQDKSHMA